MVQTRKKGQPEPKEVLPSKPRTARKSSPEIPEHQKRDGILTRSGRRVIPDHVFDGKVGKRWLGGKAKSSKGLRNPRNMCYRNSVVQALFHVPAFYHLMGNLHVDCDNSSTQCVVCALQHLEHFYWNGDKKAKVKDSKNRESLRSLHDEFNAAVLAHATDNLSDEDAEDYRAENQMDAHQFLAFLFEAINGTAQEESDQLLLHTCFDMQLQSFWDCDDCGTQTVESLEGTQLGQGVGLSVSLTQPEENLSLVEYLRENIFETRLQLRCRSPECVQLFGDDADGGMRAVIRQIEHAPDILILQLNRATLRTDKHGKLIFRRGSTVPRKIKNHVDFDEYLNLAEFTDTEDEDHDPDQELLYRLDAVVAHRGDSINGGHYIAGVRGRDGKRVCLISDSDVVQKHREDAVGILKRPTHGRQKFEPYILMYSKL